MKNHKTPISFKIYYVQTGYGLAKDAQILNDAIQNLGFSCRIVKIENKKIKESIFYKNWLYFLRKYNVLGVFKKITKKVCIESNVYALHLENIAFEKCFLNENHILIPNQEWFDPHSIDLLRFMRAVWCKSRFAVNIFNEFKCKTEFIGFCSEINESSVNNLKAKGYFFSRVGKSKYRGANLLVDVWRAHPEWPLLKIVIDINNTVSNIPENVECITTFSETDDFHALSASSLFHIYMTETEGFGHSIVEAMGYGSVLIVTNAPPMNEILNHQCAILVDASYLGQKLLAPRFGATQLAVESAVNRALALTTHEIEAFSKNAQLNYQLLQDGFIKKLAQVIKAL